MSRRTPKSAISTIRIRIGATCFGLPKTAKVFCCRALCFQSGSLANAGEIQGRADSGILPSEERKVVEYGDKMPAQANLKI